MTSSRRFPVPHRLMTAKVTEGKNESGGSRHDHADQLNDEALIRELQKDNRMRLTITKDFTKERKQSLLGGLVVKDDRPAQRRFTCVICQQAFLHSSDCLDHIEMHIDIRAKLDKAQLQHIFVSELSEEVDDLEKESVEDESQGNCEDRNGQHLDSELEDIQSKEDNINNSGMVVSEKECHYCTVCNASFSSNSHLRKHVQQIHTDSAAKNIYICKVCGKTFLGMKVLRQHCKQEHPKAKASCFVCPVCSLSFSTKSSLTVHKRDHKCHRPLKCNINGCNRAFPDVASVNRHRRSHSEERPHVCQHCGKAFKMQNHLREHVRLHTGEKPFVCEVCGAGFAQSNGLKSHAKQHSLDRDNQCDICHKAFSRRQYLELHKKVHSGEKPFSCDQCDQTFRAAANLGAHKKLKHEMNRNEEKSFTCDMCGASFSQACNLGIHKKKKHSDLPVSQEKNFVCDICDARFSEACNLGAHNKIKHTARSEDGRNIFNCDICGAKFYRLCNLSGHKKRKHGNTQDCSGTE